MPNETRLEPPDGFGDVASLKCLDCAALEQENEKLRYKWDSETCGRCGYMRSPVSFCKCGQFGIVGTNDQLRLQIESLTTQLAEAREAMEKAPDLISCESIEPCKGSIRCNGCEAKFILKAAIEAAGGVK